MNRNVMVTLGCAVLAAGFCLSMPASAQKMYRCGNAFQETPCTGTQQGKEIKTSPTRSQEGNANADAGCAVRGEAALKIIWAREAGATSEKALADIESKGAASRARNIDYRSLVEEVYHKRGSASEIRAAIEADCMKEKEVELQATAHDLAAARLRGQSQATAAPRRTVENDSDAAASTRNREQEAANEAADAASRKKKLCDSLTAKSEAIGRSQRQGQSATSMDRLRTQQESLRRQAIDADC